MKDKLKQFKPIKEDDNSTNTQHQDNQEEQEKIKSTPSKENQSNLPVTKRLFIGGIDKSITEQQIKERFIKYGKVLSIEFVNKDWKDTLFGYVEFKAKNDLMLHQCLSTLNMLTWKGHKLRIEYAKDDMMNTYKQERKDYFLMRKEKNKQRHAPQHSRVCCVVCRACNNRCHLRVLRYDSQGTSKGLRLLYRCGIHESA